MFTRNVAILGDPNGSLWHYAEYIHAYLNEKETELRERGEITGGSKKPFFELYPIDVKQFPDGEYKIQIMGNIRGRDAYFLDDVARDPSESFLISGMTAHTMRNSSADIVNIVMPCMRFSRQDRKDMSRVPITASFQADVLSRYADRVITVDVHNDAIQGTYSSAGANLDLLRSFPVAAGWFRKYHPELLENIVVMSPDEGGAKRASAFAKRLGNVPLVVCYKERGEYGQIEHLNILGKVRGKNVLIVDDMADTGRTLIKACIESKEQGAKNVGAYCTHGKFSKGSKHITDRLDLVVVSDTIRRSYDDPKLKVITLKPLFANAIYRIASGESVSELVEGTVEV